VSSVVVLKISDSNLFTFNTTYARAHVTGPCVVMCFLYIGEHCGTFKLICGWPI
jgi:hypothetical protein